MRVRLLCWGRMISCFENRAGAGASVMRVAVLVVLGRVERLRVRGISVGVALMPATYQWLFPLRARTTLLPG